MSTATNAPAVTVIGLGPMGRAMAGAYLDKGWAVTLWNRSPGRADELVARGAALAASVDEALVAGGPVVLSLTDYDAMYAILEPAAASLPGQVIVNLTSDTPERARAAADWFAGHGARHLTGGVNTPPSGIGTSQVFTFYSGPRDLFDELASTLEVLTGTDYRGEDPGLAALYYQIGMDLFWTTMLSWVHALAIADANGISAAEFLPYASQSTGGMSQFFEFYTPRIDAGEFPGDVDRLAMGVASIEHVLHTTEAAGVDTALPKAVLELFARGVAGGHADDSFTSLFEVMRGSRKAA